MHAAHHSHLLGTNLWVQMTIPLQKREEGRLTRLQRASTRILLTGQTTLIPSTEPVHQFARELEGLIPEAVRFGAWEGEVVLSG